MCPNSLCACNAFHFLIRQHPLRVDREIDLVKTLLRQSESHVCRFGHSGTEPGQPKSNRSFQAQKCYSFVNLHGHVFFYSNVALLKERHAGSSLAMMPVKSWVALKTSSSASLQTTPLLFLHFLPYR